MLKFKFDKKLSIFAQTKPFFILFHVLNPDIGTEIVTWVILLKWPA